jgi:mannitol-1-/sugar-/sorbitol-6-phosphatase
VTQLSVDALLLDLDGTLVDSTASVLRNWRRIAAMLGRDGEDLVGNRHGIPGRQVLRMIEPDLSEERIRELDQALIDGEVADTRDVVPTRGAHQLLEAIPADRWAIVTSGPRRLAQARLRAAGLPVPPVLVTADDVRVGKPDPAPFELGARRLGWAPERCLAIEDAPAGIAAARAAACSVLGVLTTFPALDADTVKDLTAVVVEVTPAGLVVTYPSSDDTA